MLAIQPVGNDQFGRMGLRHADQVSDLSQARQPTAAGSAANAAPIQAAPDTPATDALAATFAQFAEMMSALDEQLGNDQMLRMLIGLMLLIALLSPQQNEQPNQPAMATGMGDPGAGGLFIQQSYTSLSISIEQTTMTSTTYVSPDAFANPADTQPQSMDFLA